MKLRVQLSEFWHMYVCTHVIITQIKISNILTNFFPLPISPILSSLLQHSKSIKFPAVLILSPIAGVGMQLSPSQTDLIWCNMTTSLGTTRMVQNNEKDTSNDVIVSSCLMFRRWEPVCKISQYQEKQS